MHADLRKTTLRTVTDVLIVANVGLMVWAVFATGDTLEWIDMAHDAIVLFFSAEIGIRIRMAGGAIKFLRGGKGNVFDFVVTSFCLMPYVTILRAVQLWRFKRGFSLDGECAPRGHGGLGAIPGPRRPARC